MPFLLVILLTIIYVVFITSTLGIPNALNTNGGVSIEINELFFPRENLVPNNGVETHHY